MTYTKIFVKSMSMKICATFSHIMMNRVFVDFWIHPVCFVYSGFTFEPQIDCLNVVFFTKSTFIHVNNVRSIQINCSHIASKDTYDGTYLSFEIPKPTTYGCNFFWIAFHPSIKEIWLFTKIQKFWLFELIDKVTIMKSSEMMTNVIFWHDHYHLFWDVKMFLYFEKMDIKYLNSHYQDD